jgi:hypothetical protein
MGGMFFLREDFLCAMHGATDEGLGAGYTFTPNK